MLNNKPRVSIGMPVFNGENYLAEALDSLLTQTFSDFELIISDNASTDKTEEICRAYAVRDQRIRYFRNQENLGASRNYNRVFELSSGEYFKWAAHDDLCAPEFLERCVDVLDQDPSVILCYSRARAIDEHREVLRSFDAKPKLGSSKPHERFYECVCVPHSQVAVFGVMRVSTLKKTRLIGNFSSSDRTLLGELALLGRFHEIPEFLSFKRHHPQQHWRIYRGRHAREVWYDPARARKITFPNWRLLWEHLVSIRRAPLSGRERAWCYLYMGWWIRHRWRHLGYDLILRDRSASRRARKIT